MEARTPLDVRQRDNYLARLGWSDVPPPTSDALVALHRAHVERIAYTSLWIALGEQRTIDLQSSLRYVTSGAGGYCYHLNGAFSVLLEWLGFDVQRHLAGVEGHLGATGPAPPLGATGNHLAVTAAGHLVDVGLGDGLHEPLPLTSGEYDQGPFRFRLRPSEAEPGGWRFDHDPAMSFVGFDLRPGPVREDEFAERHRYLMTSPESGFVRVVVAQRRDASGVDSLKDRVLTRVDGTAHSALELADGAEWQAVLRDQFGLRLDEIDPARLAAVWQRICARHEPTTSAGAG